MAEAESEYGPRNRLLYSMDRGMTLHLAGEYMQSNARLEAAAQEVERLYTRTIRTETAAFLTNDNVLPYEGDPYEHVMINIIKALNYAAMGQLMDAVVEARQIDHRLNVLSDTAKEKDGYREDAFARYLTGVLYGSHLRSEQRLHRLSEGHQTSRGDGDVGPDAHAANAPRRL